MTAVVVVSPDPDDARQLRRALLAYSRQLRSAGKRLNPGLCGDVVHHIPDRSGQEWTQVAFEEAAGEGEAMSPLLLTYTEAGAALGGLSERTVARLVASGELPKVQLLGRRYVRPEDLREYVDSRCRRDGDR